MGNSNTNTIKNKKEEDKVVSVANNKNISVVENRISNFKNEDYNSYNNDSTSKIKQSLKYLHKNNFISLTFEDLNAYYIQSSWKHHIINKNRSRKRGIVEIIYTTLDTNPIITSRQDRLFVNLDIKRYPYRCYDLMKYSNLKSVVQFYGGYENLPTVFINGYYIGSARDFQEMEDMNLTGNIIMKEYERRCLVCNIVRIDKTVENCPHCYKNYLFFTKSGETFNLYENRHKFNIKFEN